ncbi:DUF6076 domain-containing protein [Ruminococcaceae bacterium OttesenSCG-928-L11]|nr:DUF6076 domain-containing protein [Ruminococcaceae bacterium OttesenSCG-928-L11]
MAIDDVTMIKPATAPLSCGFICGSRICFKVNVDFAGEICFEHLLGKNLIDFAWIDVTLMRTMLEQLFSIYLSLRDKNEDYGFVVEGLLAFAERYLSINCYFSAYLLGFVEFLLDERLDLRLLSNIAVEDFLQTGYFVFSETDELPILEKRRFTELFLQSILERQALVEQTLHKVLADKETISDNALERYYNYETNDDLFREHWNSRFEVALGKKSENTEGIFQLSTLNRIDDMLRYELVQLLIRDVQYKCCQNCGKLFIPSGRSDSLYCGRIMPGQQKPCNQIGANLVAKKKVETTPALKLYRQAYQRLNKRVEFGYMEKPAFDLWKTQALPKRKACEEGRITIEAFTMWIDETSRRK